MPRGRPLSLRERLYPQEDTRPKKNELHPHQEAHHWFLREARDQAHARGRTSHPSVNEILDFVPAADASAVRACAENILRFHNPKTGRDMLVPALCHNYYCWRCPEFAHHKRMLYHARKLASLDPSEIHPVPQVVNLVFTLPPQLHAWARTDPRFFPAWRRAILRTVGQAYGYEGRAGYPVDRAAFKELGAILNLHAIGDEATPWPKWAPHYDIIMPAWKRVENKIEPLRTTWPERYSRTNRRYQENLRHTLLPLAKRPTPMRELDAFLASDFKTDWHVSRPPRSRTNPGARGIIHHESAMHRIRYSCRPLFTLANARLSEDDDGRLLMEYSIDQGKRRRPLRHTSPLGPVLGQLQSIRAWMQGRMTRSWAGILSRTSYDQAATLAGHAPARERQKKGLLHKATYEPRVDGGYIKTTRRVAAPSLQREDESEDA